MELPQLKEAVNSGLMYELFGKYNPNPQEPAIPQELLEEAAAQTDTALWVLGRRSGGEESDRHLENDFTLSPEEEALLEALRRCGATFEAESAQAVPAEPPITKADLYALGLTGGPDSGEKRRALLRRLEADGVSRNDPQGSYTGRPRQGERPVQDADDL